MLQRGIFHEKPFVFTILGAAINAKRFLVINVDAVGIFSGTTTSLVKNAGGDMMFDYTMDNETLDAIHAAEVLKEFCGYVRCEDCPFCSLGECSLMSEDCYFPEDWKIPERE